ncbi:MAG TPA: carboxypeptidase regulatory-like domain-containing protein, partial [Solirubrobacteraceae bacterium]|nr:carboxypeptidase regulatory-like domain-containing protein [Solirubrobacteraceae bacterium]
YTVKFSTLTYAPQYYSGKANAAEATPVSVTAGSTTPEVNASLQAGGEISGTVTDAFTKKPLAGALVCVSPSVGLGCDTTNAAGEYSITGLGTEAYTVKFSDPTYASQYYNGKEAAAEATPVAVKAGAAKSGINATLQPSGEITGRVTDSSTTKAIAGATVCAAGAAGEACAVTGESGEYAIAGLDTGEYTVKFLASTYVPQYYAGKAKPSEATQVAIKAGGTTTGINASLVLGGRISGQVTDASTSKVISGATVCASPSGGLGCATTNSSGEYTITGLATGAYTVKFSASTYAFQYYNGKANASEATPVSVTAGATTSAINAALKPSGQITGKVTDASSSKKPAVAGATVCATGAAGESCGTTNESGEYTIAGLGGGEYKLMFSAAGYVTQYYNGKANASEATLVSVKAGATTKEINAQLEPEPKFEVEVLQRFSNEATYTEEPLKGKAPAKLEYEIVVINTGSVPVKVESVTDPMVPGCQTSSPRQSEVKPGETTPGASGVVEAVCSRTVGKEGGTVKNAATVKAGGKEEMTGEVEALVEGELRFETELRERVAVGDPYTKGPLTGMAPLTVEYEILVTNSGSVPMKVESIRDAAVSGCQTTSPKHPEVKVGESGVVEAACFHTIEGEGETFKDAAVVKASGKEASTGQVEAATETAPEPTPTPEPEQPSSPSPSGTPQTGSPSNTGNVLGTQSTTLSHAQIVAALARLLTPAAKSRVIAALLKSAGVTLQASGLEAGTLQITWYELPPGAKLAAKKTTAKPVVVATGRVSVPAGGGVKVKIKLTSAGTSLLKHSKRQKLTARAIFTPGAGTAVSDTGSFDVKR